MGKVKGRAGRSKAAQAKSSAASRKTDAGAIESTAAKQGTKRVRNFRRCTREKLAVSFPSIVDKLIEQASDGELASVRLLFDVGAVKEPAKAGGKRRKEPSLAQMLLDELEQKKRDRDAGTDKVGTK